MGEDYYTCRQQRQAPHCSWGQEHPVSAGTDLITSSCIWSRKRQSGVREEINATTIHTKASADVAAAYDTLVRVKTASATGYSSRRDTWYWSNYRPLSAGEGKYSHHAASDVAYNKPTSPKPVRNIQWP